MKILLLLTSALSLVLADSAAADQRGRYGDRPPVIVSPDLTAPWLMQLGAPVGAGRPVRRQVVVRQAPAPRTRFEAPPGVRVGGTVPAARQPLFGQRRTPALVQPVGLTAAERPVRPIDPQFLPQTVAYESGEKPGTVVIDTNNRFLYLIEGKGQARRYGVGVGKPGFEWAGTHTVTRKAEWPTWTPPAEMRSREAAKGHYLPASMEGGPANPLGARAMYLGSTLYRIHGTNAPWTIGYAVSSGCIRMRNEDVTDLYERVTVGTKVKVI
ncbi:L,D-transpeptidase [Rhizobium sp. YIM 134829]|uniref:L,D-transpeptidase n=1 Tax=Rhizobium sp. YIM 134829 TaxID=3390453 RepID=UPI00397A778A